MQLPVVKRHGKRQIPSVYVTRPCHDTRVQLLGGSVELSARPPDPRLHTQSTLM